jgi:hypothetical protein
MPFKTQSALKFYILLLYTFIFDYSPRITSPISLSCIDSQATPDQSSVLVVTFGDVRRCLEDAFGELYASNDAEGRCVL